MRHLGLLLIFIGCAGGSLLAVLDPAAIPWTYFVPLLLVGALGVAVVQYGIRREATDESLTSANLDALGKALTQITERMAELDHGKDDMDVYGVPDHIDATFRAPIDQFVDARESIAYVFGTQSYADVMSHFAAGERYLNRVWSCAADGYADEAHDYIGRAREQFQEALTRLRGLDAKTPAT